MINWLTVAVAAYFLLAIVSLADKFLLGGSLSNPKVYAFYVGVLGSLAFLLVPLGFFIMPGDFFVFAAALLSGSCQILGTYFYFDSLKKFETSRIIPAIGGLQPIFAFALTWFFAGGKDVLTGGQAAAFFLMVAGSVTIVYDPKAWSFKSFKLGALAAFLYALAVVLAKTVYTRMAFFPGFILISIGSVAAALFFLVFKEVRREAFRIKGPKRPVQTTALFFSNQALGASAFVLQSYAVSLAPFALVAVINALAGVQYIFLFLFSTLASVYFPKLIKENISRRAIVQKILAIILISSGLLVLALH
jgi:drug/metabolite transporter (DMT)-like permease